MLEKLLLNSFIGGALCLLFLGFSFGEALSPASLEVGWKEFVEVSRVKGWGGVGHPLIVKPTQENGKIYIPYDVSDAWRELDIMLPKEYIDNVAKKFSENCSSDEVDEASFQAHYYLLYFLEENWLEQPRSRLLIFFQQYFHLSLEGVPSPRNKELMIGAVLCGYYEKERLGHFPDLSALTKKFSQAIKD